MSDKVDGITFCIGNVQIWWHFEPRDIWIGVYWNRELDYADAGAQVWTNEVYVCLLPMLPIRFMWFSGFQEATHGD